MSANTSYLQTVNDGDIEPAASIVIVDDHPMTRYGMAQMLNAQPGLHVVAEFERIAAAMDFLQKQSCDLLIADVTFPDASGFELIRGALALHPSLRILICSMHDESILGERAIKAGARGYIMKDEGGQVLVHSVRRILQGHVFVGGRLAARLADNLSSSRSPNAHSPVGTLSDRELEIFDLIGGGRTASEIARLLRISVKTVNVHRGHIMAKLGLPNTTALVHHAATWTAAKR